MGNNATQWRKSSYSGDQGGSCVEVAESPGETVAVRDSKNPAGPTVKIDPAAFTTFLNWTSTAAE
ncbi:DUF397 domain-containing protein [Streptomyces pseudovenezuelae]|uniref:DUF397 domain-containing protein n=1 Tax=Streptomyces pseudovenezuelae TaxID=67350 RepID=A0ABT6LGB7_9ACTN|nr:DUF397 domain-containing protein [Streptomyces pseudovenezuelae]MDH6215340.1 hypothetical protein [Streptomyces pseudovenezuelae]